MNHSLRISIVGLALAAGALAQSPAALDADEIERIVGPDVLVESEDATVRISRPRTDVAVTMRGRRMEPAMGLTSWAMVTPGKMAPAMMLGDLIVFEDEITPVLDAVLSSGLTVTALHQQFVQAQPSVYSMHIGGEGSADALARGVRAAFDAADAVRQSQPQPVADRTAASVPGAKDLSPGAIGEALGLPCRAEQGIVTAMVARTVRLPCGCVIGSSTGESTSFAFTGSDRSALLDGTIVTFAGELQPVLKAIRRADIEVIGIHSQFEGESPAAIAVHCVGTGDAIDLARGARAVLAAQSSAKGGEPISGSGMQVEAEMKPTLYPLSETKWVDAPPSVPPGAKIAVLEGDPTKEGPFVFRLKLPDGYRIPPHMHPKVERITVIQGTFNVGMGEKFEQAATKPMPTGTYGFWPEGMKHFVWAKGETILQFHGTGPWTITYLNPADDPRNAKK